MCGGVEGGPQRGARFRSWRAWAWRRKSAGHVAAVEAGEGDGLEGSRKVAFSSRRMLSATLLGQWAESPPSGSASGAWPVAALAQVGRQLVDLAANRERGAHVGDEAGRLVGIGLDRVRITRARTIE